MTNLPDDRALFGRLAPPHPPVELREKVLAAALRAAEQPPTPSAWQAVREFFASQPRWTAALAVVLIAHLLLGLLPGGSRPVETDLPRNLEMDAQPDLLRLPRIEKARFSLVAAPIEQEPGEGDPS